MFIIIPRIVNRAKSDIPFDVRNFTRISRTQKRQKKFITHDILNVFNFNNFHAREKNINGYFDFFFYIFLFRRRKLIFFPERRTKDSLSDHCKRFSENSDIFFSEFSDLCVSKKFQAICLNHQYRFSESSESLKIQTVCLQKSCKHFV